MSEPRLMQQYEVEDALRAVVGKFKTQREATTKLKCTPAQLSTTLSGQVDVVPRRILKALKLRAVVVYVTEADAKKLGRPRTPGPKPAAKTAAAKKTATKRVPGSNPPAPKNARKPAPPPNPPAPPAAAVAPAAPPVQQPAAPTPRVSFTAVTDPPVVSTRDDHGVISVR